MRKLLLLAVVSMLVLAARSQKVTLVPGLNKTGIKFLNGSNTLTPCIVWTPDDWDPNSNKKYPLIIAYHGAEAAITVTGVTGNQDTTALFLNGILITLKNGEKAQTVFGGQLVKFIVVAPQAGSYSPDTSWLNPNFNDLSKRLLIGEGGVVKIDSSRIYLTGYSAGGRATIGNTCLSTGDSIYSRLIAAVVPMAPATQDVNFPKLNLAAKRGIHFISFTGALDPSYITQAVRVQDTIQKYNNTLFPIADVMPGNAHCCFDQYWDTAFAIPGFGKNIYQWLLQWQRGTSNSPPILSAGANQTLTLPASSTTLNGTAQAGSSRIISTGWSQLSGPSQAVISSPGSLSTRISNLVQGTYVFQLSGTDSLGLTAFSATQVLVQPAIPPAVSAGGNQTIIQPVSSVFLNGTASKGTGGPVVSTVWTQTSGPGLAQLSTPNALATTASGLVAGNYVFRLTIADSAGTSRFDSAVVTVYSPNGYSVYVRLYGGTAPFQNPLWNNWNVGTGAQTNKTSPALKYSDGSPSPFVAKLSMQDNLGDNGVGYTTGASICPDSVLRFTSYTTSSRSLTFSGLDNTQKYNLEFYASRARTDGQKTTFTIGSQVVTVSTDNNSSSAAKFSAIAPSGGQILVNLTRGSTYNYLNGFKIAVNVPATPPTVNAGTNQTLTLPLSTATLHGTVTAGSSKIVSTQWSQLSGPAPASFDSANRLNTHVSGLLQGVYVFKLTATDSLGSSAASTTQVTVLPAVQGPTVSAGNPQSVTLPVAELTLTGSVTRGSSPVTSTSWSQVSGPAGASIVSSNLLSTRVTGLVTGIYGFKLTALDSNGLSASATVTDTVLSGQLPPQVNAGVNQVIAYPGTSGQLNGNVLAGTGTILSISWTQVSGPNTAVISNPGSAGSGISGLIKGIYVFKLSAADNQGLQATAQTTVRVDGFPKRIGVIGSSTALGYFNSLYPYDSSWAGQLKAYYKRLGLVDTLYNIAQLSTNIYNAMPTWYYPNTVFPGNTTYDRDTIYNIDAILKKNVDVILVHYPSNNYDALNITQIMFAFRTIKARADSAGIPIYFLSTQPRGNLNSSEHQRLLDVRDSLNAQFGSHAIDYYNKVSLVPNSFWMNPVFWLNADSVHMNPRGHDSILAAIKTANIFGLNPPQVFAGSNQALTFPTSSLTLNGMVTPGGNRIVNTIWTQTSGPAGAVFASPAAASTLVSGLLPGTYGFQLTATDSLGLSASSVVQVLVLPGAAPRAGTGNSQTLVYPNNIAVLTGRDTAGSSPIARVRWTQASGPAAAVFIPADSLTSTATGLLPGLYIFLLTVTDSLGRSATATTQVTVLPAVGPKANAGLAQSLQFPTSSVILSGQDSVGSSPIVAVMWSQFSGPAPASIGSKDSLQTIVTGLQPGVYVFKLLVTDSLGLNANATVTVTVLPPLGPRASAGYAQTLHYPLSSVLLTGVDTAGSDPITRVGWTLVTGPGAVTIVQADSLATVVNGLVPGTYQFNLTVTDSLGLTANSSVVVTVQPALPPRVAAGSNQSQLVFPASTVQLIGVDTAGSAPVVAVSWRQVSGPVPVTFSRADSLVIVAQGLLPGVYDFNLEVTDSLGLTGISTVRVTVLPALAPHVGAGPDQSIVFPLNSVNLTGMDTVGSSPIISMAWSQISGPGTAIFSNPGQLSTNAGNLVPGTYQFNLSVTDSLGLTAQSTVQVTVLPALPPHVGAGSNQSLVFPASTVTLTGIDTAGSSPIVTFAWTQISGTGVAVFSTPDQLSTSATNLVPGTYQFNLTVTDSLGLTAQSTVQVTVLPALPPHVGAGSNQSLVFPASTVTLTGIDTAGSSPIVTFAWTQISGTGVAVFSTPDQLSTSATNLVPGTYQFNLTVTDSLGLTAQSTVQVFVLPALPPHVGGGSNQSIVFPVNTVALIGRDTAAGSPIVTVLWSQDSGPSPAGFGTPDQLSTVAGNLVPGTYQFKITITDSLGLTAQSSVQVLVLPALPPHVGAGSNQTVVFPVNAVQLTGKDTAAGSPIVTVLWSQDSGPSPAVFSTPDQLSTVAGNLVPGTYQFKIIVTDSIGLTAASSLQVTVLPALPPKVGAGINQTLIFPESTAQLTAMDTAAGSPIVSVLWSQDSGPSPAVFSTPDQLSTVAGNLVPGTYQFKITVTDSLGLTAQSTVQAFVLPALPPHVVAGSNQSLLFPRNVVTLAARDTAGSSPIVSILWSQLSGPSPAGFDAPNALQTRASGLVPGTYSFQVLVTDSLGLTASSTLQVLVSPALPPQANAGVDQSIVFPVNTVTLTGSSIAGSSPVVLQAWSQVSGPGSASISLPGAATTTVGGMIPGTYLFAFSVTDSLGTQSADTMQVTVRPAVLPLVSAGSAQSITLPQDSVSLVGTVTTGSSRILATNWSQLSGPGTATIQSPASLGTMATHLTQGNYQFRLLAVDSLRDSVIATVNITVNAALPSVINVRLYAGTAPFQNSKWNNWNVGTGSVANKASGVLKYTDGSASAITAVLSYQDNLSDNGVGYTKGATMCPDTVLRFVSYSTSNRTLVFSGLNNAKKYNLSLYASRSRTDGQKTVFTIGTSAVTVGTDNNSATAASFTALVPASGKITVSLARTSVYNYLNGFTLTEVTTGTAPAAYSHFMENNLLAAAGNGTEEVKVFPNPATDHFTVWNGPGNTLKIELIDMQGRELLLMRSGLASQLVPLNRYAAGIYVVLVTDEKTGRVYRKMLMKN